MTAPLSRWSAGRDSKRNSWTASQQHEGREKGTVRMLGNIRLPRSSIRASAAGCKRFEPRKLIGAAQQAANV
jgi:hypothetical protein